MTQKAICFSLLQLTYNWTGLYCIRDHFYIKKSREHGTAT